MTRTELSPTLGPSRGPGPVEAGGDSAQSAGSHGHALSAGPVTGAGKVTTVRQASLEGRRLLHGLSPTPDLDADVLLGHVLGWPRARLITHDLEVLAPAVDLAYKESLNRRAAGTPVAYLTGWKEWFGLAIEVSPAVLIPRPETELLVEQAVAVGAQARAIVDVGTGSGAIAIALARVFPEAEIIATDVSPDAVILAERNVSRLAPGRVRLLLGDLLSPLDTEPDLIVANLPYISDADMAGLPADVRAEPALALRAGPRGLDVYARLFEQAKDRGWAPTMMLEIDPRQREEIVAMAHAAFDESVVDVIADFAGKDRIVRILNVGTTARE